VAAKLTEIRIDHDGNPTQPGVYALAREDGAIVGYKVRWGARVDGVPVARWRGLLSMLPS
jgi:hypothetical protein